MPRPDPSSELEILNALGMEPSDLFLMFEIAYGPKPYTYVARAAALDTCGDPLGEVSEPLCQAAFERGIDKGWYRIIDEESLRALKAQVDRQGAPPPLYGFPEVGDADFTQKGVNVYADLCKRLERCSAEGSARKDVYRKEVLYFSTIAAAQSEIEELKQLRDTIRVSDPEKTGPWSIYWWDTFPDGYRVILESGEDSS